MKHGGDLSDAMARHGGSVDDWLDLSTGINPWAWPISDTLPPSAWRRLPSSADCDGLLDAARLAYVVPDGVDLVAAPGTQSVIQWLPRLAAPGPVAIVSTTYDEHAIAWTAAGHEAVGIEDMTALPAAVRHAVVVNPNNPDGRVTGHVALAHAGAKMAERGGWLIIDESFADVAPGTGACDLCTSAPVVVLRSFGKFFGLAGLRLGFAIATPAIAARISVALGPWPVSGPALAVGRAALADDGWQSAMRRRLADQATALDAELARAGLDVIGGTSLFRLVRCDGVRGLHERLAARRIWTRVFERHPDVMRFGLPADQAGLERLAEALARPHG